jgi:hypothetical protein
VSGFKKADPRLELCLSEIGPLRFREVYFGLESVSSPHSTRLDIFQFVFSRRRTRRRRQTTDVTSDKIQLQKRLRECESEARDCKLPSVAGEAVGSFSHCLLPTAPLYATREGFFRRRAYHYQTMREEIKDEKKVWAGEESRGIFI